MKRLYQLRRTTLTWAFAALILSAGFMASGCALSRVPATGEKDLLAWSWAEEVQLGQQSHQQIQATYGLYDNEELNQYVDRVGQAVLAESQLRAPDTPAEIRNTPVHFYVLDSEVVNAFALPGGFVYVTRGLVAHLNNEAQLASVLGHELGHVAARHAAQQAADQQLGQIGLLAGAILGQQIGLPGGTILDLGSQAVQLLFLSYSRGDEREADELGVAYAAQAGYEAAEGAEFFNSLERIREKAGQALPTWLSTHPDPGNREQTIIQLAQEWEQRAQMTIVNQDAHYDAIDNIVLGVNPRQGYVEGSVFYHPELRFSFPVPRGWQVANQASQVTMVEPNQQAIMALSLSQASSAQAAAREFSQQQGLQVVEQGSAESNGLPAYYVVVAAQTQQGGNIRAVAYFIEYRDQVYNFLGYTNAQLFNRYQDAFLRTMQGFDRVTDRDVLNRQPAHLNVESVSRTDDFRSFIEQEDLPMEMDIEELAIMNQLELSTQVQAGTELKLAQQ